MRIKIAFAGALLAVSPWRAHAQSPGALSDSAFAALVERLSEPGGYFNTDNLISNEDSYLHPLTTLHRIGTNGGVYVGVGPDQNFSYIAAVRPHAAFIVDIRRDNLLEHLLFKAVFALARNRLEYLCLLFGRTPPPDTTGWGARGVDTLLAYVSRSPLDTVVAARIRARVLTQAGRSAIHLSTADLQTITRFHSAFIVEGPSLRFNTLGRAPQPYYPDFRRLASETDRNGRQASVFAAENDFQFVKSLEGRNLVIPVVGDFAGPHALQAVAAWMDSHAERLSILYTSNVEQYLFRDRGFDAFAASVERFPRDSMTVIIRSCFVCGGGHPDAVAGYYAVQMVQFVDRFVALHRAGRLVQYPDVITVGIQPP